VRFQGGAHRIRHGAILMSIADKNIMGHGCFLQEVWASLCESSSVHLWTMIV
jgi:hypothetical protein